MENKKYWVWKYPNHSKMKKVVLITNCAYEADECVMDLEARGIPAKYFIFKNN